MQDPLSGRKVMIPLTSKAFLEGSLQPHMAGNQEQVIVKLSEKEFVEMTRTEAQKLLEERIDVLKKAKVKQSVSNEVESKMTADQTPSIPYFEIREEYDKDGNEIRAEAINVAKELEYLQREENNKLDSAARAAVLNQDSDLLEVERHQNECQRIVDSEEYEKISNRLDELARLEQEMEARKRINEASSKKLQGSGWAKGFLNKKGKDRKVKEMLDASNEIKENEALLQPSAKKVNFLENCATKDLRSKDLVASESKPTKMHASRPIESRVFSGVIKEREVGEREKARHQTKESVKKPLSLFAQRRQAQQH